MRDASAVLLVALVIASGGLSPPARAASFAEQQQSAPRVKDARARVGDEVKARFAARGVAYPAAALLLRHFKAEGELELWAAGAPGDKMVLIKTFPVCASSGALGPKRRRGDLQVPEGFYVVDRYNAWSSFHLSLGIDYPNRADRLAAQAAGIAHPGGDIFVHGDCVTIGCVPLQDGPVEELYLAALDTRLAYGGALEVHMFPARLDDEGARRLLQRAPSAEVAQLWRDLKRGYDLFEQTRRPPRVEITVEGRYRLRSGKSPARAFRRTR